MTLDFSLFSYTFTFLISIIALLLCTSWLRRRTDIRAPYTRKMVHVGLFLLPGWILATFPVPSPITIICINALILLGITIAANSSARLSQLLIHAIDRPNDQPYTIILLQAEIVITYTTLGLLFYFLSLETLQYLPIIFIVIAFADAGAELVGVAIGKYHYPVYSLIRGQKHVRSLEGSVAFFVVTALILLWDGTALPPNFTWLTITSIALALTATEAASPHTFDTPTLLLCYASAITLLV